MEKDQPIESNEFSTMDLYLGGYLTMKGHKGAIRFPSSGKAILIFPLTAELSKAVQTYSSDDMVPVFRFVQEVKGLRAQLHKFREERQGDAR
jgi:hypothetical protein